MKTLPANLIIEANKAESKYAWLVCVEINLLSGTVLRLVRNFEDIAIREDDYTKAGCVGHWKMNDNAANTVVVDSGPNSLTGTLVGGDNTEDITTTGKVGAALALNGSDDMIAVSDVAALDFGIDDFCVSLWARIDGYSNQGSVYNVIITKGIIGATATYWSLVIRDDNKVYFIVEDYADAAKTASSNEALDDASLHHIVAVRQSGAMSLYVDGVLQTDTGTNAADVDNAKDVEIGGDTGGSARFFDGVLDNVAIFNRALSSEEIAYLYNAGAGTETVPRLYTAFPLVIEPTKQNSQGEIPQITLQACNITRLIQPYLEAENGGIGAEVRIIVVNSGYKAEDSAAMQETFEIIETSANWEWISFVLGAANPLRQRFPKYRYFAGSCRWRLRDSDDAVRIECSYTPENVADITLPSGSPVSVEITGHPFSTGDEVYFLDVGGTVELNSNSYTVTKTDADNFTLDGTDGDNFTAYTSGGTCGYYTCPRTLEACDTRGNLARYGGFYCMASGGVRIV